MEDIRSRNLKTVHSGWDMREKHRMMRRPAGQDEGLDWGVL